MRYSGNPNDASDLLHSLERLGAIGIELMTMDRLGCHKFYKFGTKLRAAVRCDF